MDETMDEAMACATRSVGQTSQVLRMKILEKQSAPLCQKEVSPD
jgi:hypothetical protein